MACANSPILKFYSCDLMCNRKKMRAQNVTNNINNQWFYVAGQVQKRLRRERRARRQLQEQLETEVKRRIQLEEALKAAGASDQIRIINGKLMKKVYEFKKYSLTNKMVKLFISN